MAKRRSKSKSGVGVLDIIGGATAQQRFPTGNHRSGTAKDVINQDAESMCETQRVERLKQGESAESENGSDERTINRTKLEDGQIIIETYTETGELVKVTPPGYLPLDRIA